MSYNEYLMQVPNNLVHDLQTTSSLDGLEEIIKKYNLESDADISDDEGHSYLAVRSLGKKVHDLGIYFEDLDIFEKHSTPLLVGEVEKEYTDYNLRILTKEGLLSIINMYRDKTLRYYKNLLKEGKEKPIKYSTFVASQITYLCDGDKLEYFANLDNDDLRVTRSTLYEHAIFNLISIYKFFDWDNNTLIFYGL